MKEGSSKFFLGILLGAAAGAAAAYLAQAEKREKLMDDLNEIAEKVKDSYETYQSVIDERVAQLKDAATTRLNGLKNSISEAVEVE